MGGTSEAKRPMIPVARKLAVIPTTQQSAIHDDAPLRLWMTTVSPEREAEISRSRPMGGIVCITEGFISQGRQRWRRMKRKIALSICN